MRPGDRSRSLSNSTGGTSGDRASPGGSRRWSATGTPRRCRRSAIHTAQARSGPAKLIVTAVPAPGCGSGDLSGEASARSSDRFATSADCVGSGPGGTDGRAAVAAPGGDGARKLVSRSRNARSCPVALLGRAAWAGAARSSSPSPDPPDGRAVSVRASGDSPGRRPTTVRGVLGSDAASLMWQGSSALRTGMPHWLEMVSRSTAGPVTSPAVTTNRAGPYVPPNRCSTTPGSSSTSQTKFGAPSSETLKASSSSS